VKILKLMTWAISRLILCLLFTSTVQRELFYPFFADSNLSLLDPWSSWLAHSGRVDAFPYGYVMFIFFLPAILLSRLFSVFSVQLSLEILVLATLTSIEFWLYKSLKVFEDVNNLTWSWLAIFSPLALYITYIHGQIDIIPAAIMSLAALFALRDKWFKAGLAVGITVAAKFSFILVLPFFLVFLVSKKARYRNGLIFAKGVLPGLGLFLLPIFYSRGYITMVLSTPEVIRTFDAQINLGIATIYLVPIGYLSVLLAFWSLNQVSGFVLISFLGSALTLIALTQTSSVGWFYWGFPLILLALREASNRTFLLVGVWQLGISIYFFYHSGEYSFRFPMYGLDKFAVSEMLEGVIFTLNAILGAVLILKILKEALKVGDIYLLSDRPFSLNIAGDSGVGKDTLVNQFAKLFGEQEVSLLLGDDYHLYERGETSWLTTTHLAPDANDLESMGRDFKKLLKRQKIFVKHYDHTLGKFTLPRNIRPSQIVIVNGLHSHLIPGAELADLKIFLSMDEDLRIEFKINRDKSLRQQSDENAIRKSISDRIPDYEQFVQPQKSAADLHLHLTKLASNPIRLGIEMQAKDSAFLYEFRNIYNAVSANPAIISKIGNQKLLEVDPTDFRGQDAILIINKCLISIDQIFPAEPRFSDGSGGVLCLISLLALARKRLNYV